MNKLLGSIINKFDAEAKNHMERQSLNPFSGNFSRSPSPRLSKDQYGKPLAGSKTEERGQKAKCHILREIQDLCNCIHDLGVYNKTHKQHQDSDDEEETNDDEIIITFGEIFQMYTKINDKVVGLLIAAKKRGFLFFEKEILFQRRDDDVLIALIKPISEIRAIINKELAAAKSPVPFQSRDVSPTVGDDSDTDKSTGNMPNGSLEGSSKSGSGSPVENNKNTSRTEVSNKGCNETAATETTISVGQPSTQVGNEDISKVVEKKTNLENEESPKTSNGESDPLPLISEEHTAGESDSKGNDETKSEVQEIPPTQQNEAVEGHPIPQIEVTSEADSLDNTNAVSSAVTKPIVQSPAEPIPTIEITKAATPERGSSEEPPITVSDELNTEQSDNNLDQISDIEHTESNKLDVNVTTDGIQNTELSNESIKSSDDVPSALPQEQVEVIIPTEIDEPTKGDDSVIQTVDIMDVIPVPNSLANDNERKRTFSNEELIESLAAALSGRSSSPDICDEEVEQIFQSHAAVTPLPNEPTQKTKPVQDTFVDHNMPEINISGQDNITQTDASGFETSEEIKALTPETVITDKTPENIVTPETHILMPESNDTLSDTTANSLSGIENILSSPETNASSLETEIPHPEATVPISDTVTETKSTSPEIQLPITETKIPITKTIVPTPENITEADEPTPETSIEPKPSA